MTEFQDKRATVTVDVVVMRKDRYLFVRRKYPPFADHYALPGGIVDPGETVPQAMVRELQEETGLVVKESQILFLDVLSDPNRDPRGRAISIVGICQVPLDAEATPKEETTAIAWLTLAELKRAELAFDHKKVFNIFNPQDIPL